MLKSWSIKNFKPIVDSGELQLAPVTVLAGRNSSGKSSLLQSILMIAQTLGSRLLDQPLITNGIYVQLGTFYDVINEAAISKDVNIHFVLEFEQERKRGSHRTVDSAQLIELDVSFVPNDSPADDSAMTASKVLIDQIYIKIPLNTVQFAFDLDNPGKFKEEEVAIEFRAKKVKEIEDFVENVEIDYYDLIPDKHYLGTLKYYPYFVVKGLVRFSHFLPVSLIEKYNLEARYEEKTEVFVRTFLRDDNPTYPEQFPVEETLQQPISTNIRFAIVEYCETNAIQTKLTGDTLADLRDWYRLLRFSSSNKIVESQLFELEDIIIGGMIENYAEKVNYQTYWEGLEESASVGYLEQTLESATRFFTSLIRYLGPLRADPGVVRQQFAPTSELDNVGTKGEFAAMVYHFNKKASIEWYNPQDQHLEVSTLRKALDTWVQYLKIAYHISTEEAGAIGITWQIVPKKGHKPRSLPELGVGVSQILPILVMGLLSPANTLLIIEQPELHMHPYVQARLGDFFMGLAKCKKQCLIETHSENLVSQLRLHIVEAGGLEKSDCMVYFVDQDEKGAANLTPKKMLERSWMIWGIWNLVILSLLSLMKW